MQLLKADTLTKVLVGPVVAVGNGFVPITTLSLSTADEAELLKHDAAAVTDISLNTFAAITSADGYYNLTITAAQVDTEGRLTILINDDSLCLPVRHDFMVVNANVYDSLYAADTTDYLRIDAFQVAGTTQDATDLADFASAGYDPVTNKVTGVLLTDTVTTYTGNTPQTADHTSAIATIDTEVGAIQTDLDNATDGLGAIKTSVDAIPTTAMRGTDSAALASVCTEVRLSELDATTAGKMANQVDIIQVDTTTDIPATITTAQNDLDIITGASGVILLTATQASIDAIELDTGTTIPATITTVDTVVDGIQTDLSNATDGLGAIKNQVDLAALATVCTETRLAELDAANLPTDIADVPTVAEFEARTPTAAQLAYIVANSATAVPVTFTTGGSTTTAVFVNVDGATASATDDQYNGRLLVFTNNNLEDVVTDITDYVGSTTTATITAIPFAPGATQTARLV